MSKLKNESGQVLILAIAVLVILLIGVFFLFDLGSVIRGKIKVSTAEEAAALAGSNWQRESLNLIGELNLLKASNLIFDDYVFPTWSEEFPDDFGTDGAIPDLTDLTPAQKQNFQSSMQAVNKSLTEMQSRVAFIGPLIGFGAAQQAAKNNGINIYDEGDSGSKKHPQVGRYVDKLRNGIDTESAEYVGYYRWRDNYTSMLDGIVSEGIAVRPNGRFPGLEGIRPPYMGDRDFYLAVLAERWCERYLLQLIKYPDSFWSNDWWRVSFMETRFPDESPIYAVGVDFFVPLQTQNEYDNFLKQADSSIYKENITPWDFDDVTDYLPNFSWCGFDATWFPESINYYGPDLEIWRRGYYLRGDLKGSFITGGATSYAETYHKMKLMNKYKIANENSGKKGDSFGYEAMSKGMIAEGDRDLNVTIGSDSEDDVSGAVAKVIGELSGGLPPHESRLVLPVFTDSVIIPTTMNFVRPMRDNFSSLEKFLVWLGNLDQDNEDIFHYREDPPGGTELYLEALQKLSDPEFRRRGYNPNYHGVSDERLYFSDSYKYNAQTNPNGAGWLQQAWLGSSSDNKNDGSKIESRPYGSDKTAHQLGSRYFLKENGKVLTNEDIQCYTRIYSPGSGGSSVNTGPPRL